MATGAAQPAFVLVRPQMGENIGAAARAMWNFGLDHMRIVDPRDGWPNPKAVAMSSGAGRLLDEALMTQSLPEALSDCHYVMATTARSRDLTKTVFSPEQAMIEAHARISQGQKVGIMFGPERAGLENDDIAQANAIISVPVNPAFPSLNLAQCVLLCGYEWQRQVSQAPAQVEEMAGTTLAEGQEIDHLAKHFQERLDVAGFFYPEHKADSMKINLRNMWSRLPLTRAEVQMLHGMMRQMVRWKEKKD